MPLQKASRSNISILTELTDLLTPMPNDVYQKQSLPRSEKNISSIGAHCRHIIEFYQSFLKGISSGKIDYDDRPRSPALETDRSLAIKAIHDIRQQLTALLKRDLKREQPTEQFNLQAQVDFGCPVVTKTNLARELVFLQAHSVHHQAMIALLMLCFEQTVPEEFGFATSTRINNKELETQATD